MTLEASMASSRTMPQPLSMIWITFLPPARREYESALIRVERIFKQLFHQPTPDAPPLSPAAIWLATRSERTWILPMSRWMVVVISVTEIAGQWLEDNY